MNKLTILKTILTRNRPASRPYSTATLLVVDSLYYWNCIYGGVLPLPLTIEYISSYRSLYVPYIIYFLKFSFLGLLGLLGFWGKREEKEEKEDCEIKEVPTASILLCLIKWDTLLTY